LCYLRYLAVLWLFRVFGGFVRFGVLDVRVFVCLGCYNIGLCCFAMIDFFCVGSIFVGLRVLLVFVILAFWGFGF